jgi:hypothetical protein
MTRGSARKLLALNTDLTRSSYSHPSASALLEPARQGISRYIVVLVARRSCASSQYVRIIVRACALVPDKRPRRLSCVPVAPVIPMASRRGSRAVERDDPSGGSGRRDESPLRIDQRRLDERDVAISVNDTPLANDPSGFEPDAGR